MEEKTLNATNIEDVKKAVSDVEVFGDGNMWTCINKASSKSQGWMKSTKVLPMEGLGCLVQVSTQQKGLGGTYAVAEALTFVPDAVLLELADGTYTLCTPAIVFKKRVEAL